MQVRLSTALVCLNFQCPIRFPPSSHRHASGTPLPAVKRGRAAASPQVSVCVSSALVETATRVRKGYDSNCNSL
jgi:hypothetical protein